MIEILAKVFGGLAGGMSMLFIVFALFTPAYAFLNGMEEDEKERKKAEKKLTMQIVIFGCVVVVLLIIAVVLAILSK